MDEVAKALLEAALSRKAERDRVAEAKRLEAAQAERDRLDRRAQAEATLPAAMDYLKGAIASVNGEVHSLGIHFELEPGPADASRLGQLSVRLVTGERSDRRIVLNIERSGEVCPVFLLPSTGKTKDFLLIDADQPCFERLLADFLGQVYK